MTGKVSISVLAVVAVAFLLLSTGAYLLRDPLPIFLERRSSLAVVREASSVVDGASVLTPVRIIATSGLTVDLVVRRAIADGTRRLPLAILLGGHYTGSDAARLIGDTPGVTIAALSYPFTGSPRPDAWTFLRDIPRIRRAFLDTPPAVMLALDYLMQRSDVDTARVEAVGVSLGVPFMCIAGALDSRVTRVWALHGSGGSYAPLEASMRRMIPFTPLRALAAGVANIIINGPHLDPVRWVSRISPRPFVMVNATDEERLPRSAIEALYQSARQPKELMWMSGEHVHADAATIQRLAKIVMSRVSGEATR